MKTPLVLLLCSFLLLLHLGDAREKLSHNPASKQQKGSPASPASAHINPAQAEKNCPTNEPTHGNPPSQPKVTVPTVPPRVEVQPNPLVSQKCLQKNFTRSSCAKVFCPPWQRCIKGQCVCKISNQCPRGQTVCGHNRRSYSSLCHAQAIACRENKAIFSHYGKCEGVFFKTELKGSGEHEVVIVNQPQTKDDEYLICGTASWNMAAANVVCRDQTNDHRGAVMKQSPVLKDIPMWDSRPQQCMSVRCTGMERSLAECVFYEPTQLTLQTHVATVTCYNQEKEAEECSEFRCVNNKCIWWNKTCDGIDDCGDYSDEMCCEGCSNGAFHCKSGVCISRDSLKDEIRDCLGGEDEMPTAETSDLKPITPNPKEEPITPNPKEDVRTLRNELASKLYCGIPNMDYLNKTEEETRYVRTKRVVGGQEANPTQIQWQVAVQEDGVIHCGGAYLGGCWVLTAAHCVRPKPQSFLIKFSLWNKLSRLSTSDAIPVRNIIIHPNYDSRSYHNDIALIQLDELPNEGLCMRPNPAVRSVCVPWSPMLFPPSSSCTISGWGRNREGDFISTLKWAEVNIIGNCSQYYKTRFMDGMECAGDLTGSVDTCQGDSGGPLVCKDALGVSYVWGIVSWGENCGEANHPGVYTKVADYFEWIRLHTGWPAVTKYNY